MNGKRLAMSVVGILVGCCATDAALAQGGVIQFHGAIVERPCSAGVSANATLSFEGCPQQAAGNTLEVKRVGQATSVSSTDGSAVAARLIPGDGGDDQHYVLVDAAGQIIRSGNYVVTVSSP